MREVTNKSRPETILYQTDAYGGTDADVSNSEVFTNASGFSIDLLSDFSEKEAGISAIVTMKVKETSGSGSTDNFKFHLYRRHDNLWTGNEIAVDADVYDAIPGAGVTIEYPYNVGLDATKGGPGHYRIGMESAGATDDFDVEVSVVVCRLLSQQT